MTKFERKLFWQSIRLGVLLTLFVTLLSSLGFLKPLELYLDDLRARRFQFFMPRPSDKIIHVDIDDAALDIIGRFPWPRQKMALILDEMYRAGAKVVDWDVLFADYQEATFRQGLPPEDPEQVFAKSVAQFRSAPGRAVIVPLSINLNDPDISDPAYLAAVGQLHSDLELTETELVTSLQSRHLTPEQLKFVDAMFQTELADAMFHRINEALDKGIAADPEVLRQALLPKSAMSGFVSDAVRALRHRLPEVLAYRALVGLLRPVPPGLPPLMSRNKEQALPIAPIADASRDTGFVDFWHPDNSRIRSIPLLIADRGRLVPQMALALACAQLGVDPNDLHITADRITIPLPDGKQIDIPVYSRDYNGQSVGMIMDIPWFGKTDEWQTMYDWPNHAVGAQHIPISSIWDICQIEPAIEENNQKVVEALKNVASLASTDDFYRVRDHAPPADDPAAWNKLIPEILNDLPPGTLDNDDYAPFLTGKAGIDSVTDPKERELALDLHKVLQTTVVNDELVQERQKLRQQLHNQLNGKAILVGEIATSSGDVDPTPLHQQCPGVVIHGTIASAILTGNFLYRAPAWISVALTIFVGLLVTLVSAYYLGIQALLLSAAIAGAFLLINFLLAYDWGRTEIDAAGPPTAAAIIWASCTLFHVIRERTERALVTSRFSSYVDPNLVNYVLEHPEKVSFDGEQRELSVVFTDLAGFTTISEMLKEQTVHLLNEYLGRMVPVISRNHGLVNKFLGDGIMFFFGAPEPYPGDASLHAWASVQTVLEMQQAMIPFNQELLQRNLPVLTMRAGISSGVVTVGDAGNPPQRTDYTVLGDRVNLASRLESANKYTGSLVLISDRTVELLRGRFLVRLIGRLQVVGKSEFVATFEPLAPIEKATDDMRKLVEMTAVMTDAFIAGKFADCAAAAQKLEETFGAASQGKLCDLYRRLCHEYAKSPPPDFAGQVKLEGK